MSDEATDLYITMAILRILDAMRGMPLREDSIFDQLSISAPGVRISRSELASRLEDIRKRGLVTFEMPVIGPKTWKLTGTGKDLYRDHRYEEEQG
jgi:hypothetical protein